MSKWNSLRKKRDKKFKEAIILARGDSKSKEQANKIIKKWSR